MKVKKMSSKLIKPLTPTPLNLNNYKISFADKYLDPTNISVVLYYESKPESDLELEESLAKTLVQFYPLAGRYIPKHLLIDCSDHGAEFVEAEAPDVDLASIIGTRQLEDLDGLLAVQNILIDESVTPPLLSVQATRFACGGVAVAITVSHRVFDASSLSTFLAAWSSNSTTPSDKKTVGVNIITPSFNLPSLLPCSSDGGDSFPSILRENSTPPGSTIFVKKNVAVDGATLARVRSTTGKQVSPARAASAIIARAFILLDGARRGGRSRGFRVYQQVNMRERTITPIPKHACGNFAFLSLSRRVGESEAEGISIPELVDLIGESTRRSIEDFAEIVSVDRDGRDMIVDQMEKVIEAYMDPDTNQIAFTDWSKFGFYEADFGWGKPVWTSIGMSGPNLIVMMSNREGDGIEAWLYLNEDGMRCFEQYDEFINQIIDNLKLPPNKSRICFCLIFDLFHL